MKQMGSRHLPHEARHVERGLAPGAGLFIAAAASILLWAGIAGVIAIV